MSNELKVIVLIELHLEIVLPQQTEEQTLAGRIEPVLCFNQSFTCAHKPGVYGVIDLSMRVRSCNKCVVSRNS